MRLTYTSVSALLLAAAVVSLLAADIAVTYALEFASRTVDYPLGEAERAYMARTIARDGYKRAMDACPDTKAWAASVAATRAATP